MRDAETQAGTTVRLPPIQSWQAASTGGVVPVVALETHGSACFYHSVAANRTHAEAPAGVTLRTDNTHDVRVAHIAELKSKATSLGASEPSAGVVRAALDRAGGVKCVTVPDEATMQLAGAFAGE